MARYQTQGDLMQTNKPSVYEINKASVLKRFASFLIDMIILVVLITGIFALMSIILHYDEEYAKVEEKYIEHGVYVLNPSSTSESDKYITCSYYDEYGEVDESSDCYLAWKEFYEDEEALALRSKCDNLVIVMLSTSSLIALLVSEFAVPLIFKNGQTLGMKIMHVGVIGTDRIRIRTWQLFSRVIVGRYAVETMIPVYCVVYMMINPTGGLLGLLIIIVLAIAEVLFLGFTKNNQVLHDLVSATVVIDIDSQFIAKNRDELEAHINEIV